MKGDYQYLGKLKYLNHDKEREQPVYFQWQLLDSKSLDDSNELSSKNQDKEEELGEIKLTDAKPDSKKAGVSKENFKGNQIFGYALKESKNRKLGLLGEELVFKYEVANLRSVRERDDLAEKVVHISKVEGDGAGYDIRSFDKFWINKIHRG